MTNPIKAYTRWLHTRWPAGKPEILPVVNSDGSTNVAGLYVVGDLSGIPLLKLSVNAGVRTARKINDELGGSGGDDETLDVAIIGGGTAGFAAAKEAEALGLKYMVFEASEPFSTIVNFPKEKPIYKYPTDMDLEGGIEFHDKSDVKEGLIEDLREQTIDQGVKWVHGRVSHVEGKAGKFELVLPNPAEAPDGVTLNGTGWIAGKDRVAARRVIVGIGRSGNYRKLGVRGEENADKVFNRLHDPKDFCGSKVLVVGGGDSAMEACISMAKCGADVTLSYRKKEFNRPKPENREKLLALAENPAASARIDSASDTRQTSSMPDMPDADPRGTVTLLMGSNLSEIRDHDVDIKTDDGEIKTVENDVVFAMIGREPPLDFFRRSGVNILGDKTARWWITLILFFALCFWVYHWKGGYDLFAVKGWSLPTWLQPDPKGLIKSMQETFGAWASSDANPIGVLFNAMHGRAFYYTLLYSVLVVVFGIRRIKRRKTPYVKWQTITLMCVQVIPLFLLPVILLPWLNGLGAFESGFGKWIEDTFFPNESWWRAYGLILAWPLMAWNWFTAEPIWGWLILGFLQTFVAIPAMVFFWGKGAYCGWICSCGAMAETLGDTQRHKMPHGPIWNRLNMIGQAFLLFAFVLMGMKILAWTLPESQYSEITSVTHRNTAETIVTFSRPTDSTWDIDDIWRVSVSDYSGPAYWDKSGIALDAKSEVQIGDRVKVQTFTSSLGDSMRWAFDYGVKKVPVVNYSWLVDLFFAGAIGYGFYFWFSGRVWCRFACPLAALMHIYARLGRFRILADKKKCISCNVCTSVCHQGIDVMSFANKGQPMADPECVRCSACVQSCPTGVLTFGQVDRKGKEISRDPMWLAASPVRIAESQVTVNGNKQS